MTNVFSGLDIYGAKWNVVESRNFTQEEIASVSNAVIVASEFGNSVCFHMVSGGNTYIPLSNTTQGSVGDTVDMASVKLLKLQREGDKDIMRVEL